MTLTAHTWEQKKEEEKAMHSRQMRIKLCFEIKTKDYAKWQAQCLQK